MRTLRGQLPTAPGVVTLRASAAAVALFRPIELGARPQSRDREAGPRICAISARDGMNMPARRFPQDHLDRPTAVMRVRLEGNRGGVDVWPTSHT
jgi:hypothetical protein